MQATHSGVVINLLPFRSGNVTRLVTIIVNFTIAFETRDLHLEKSVQTLYGIQCIYIGYKKVGCTV